MFGDAYAAWWWIRMARQMCWCRNTSWSWSRHTSYTPQFNIATTHQCSHKLVITHRESKSNNRLVPNLFVRCNVKIRKSEVRTHPCEILYFAIKVVPHVLEPLFTFFQNCSQKNLYNQTIYQPIYTQFWIFLFIIYYSWITSRTPIWISRFRQSTCHQNSFEITVVSFKKNLQFSKIYFSIL